ncbi:cell wall hydrolase [Thiomicrospira aerophila AL3]|uniref:N-acetylmuramoyl-L-alanine amidase n=1 Tax=Thiomicrospira aerophila AL3 TaxID=717772 RepID=W0DXF3_9GAMM|nr:N-acetylmuramoyl-L-alanine amidase [Thiomicrospira aerophila]AHF01556.1 cell wall hydrolase [Thiomicrospira aerophila AL3]
MYFSKPVTSKSKLGLQALFTLLLLLTSQVAIAAEVNSVRLGQTPDQTRVVFEMANTDVYRVMHLDNPPRIVIDFPGAQSNVSFRNQRFQDPRLSGIRMATDAQRTRVVLDLSAGYEYKHFVLAKTAQRPQRLVVDISERVRQVAPPLADTQIAQAPVVATPAATVSQSTPSQSSPATVVAKAPQPAPAPAPAASQTPAAAAAPKPTAAQPVSSSPQPAVAQPAVRNTLQQHNRMSKEFVIAIDPGHGGNDVGAIGPSGLFEKDVVLAISKQLKAEIDRLPGMRAVLTRDRDVYVGLDERARIARRHQADLFVSVHADAYTSPQPRGGSVYVLSQRGASSAMARAIAERENEALGIVTLAGRDQDVAFVLSDLSRESSLQASRKLGSQVLAAMNGNGLHLHKSSVQAANFAVLRSIDMPSILVEAAFISNPEDERLLVNPRFQQQFARSLASGLQAFLQESGHKPNWGEPLFVRHQIQRGDNLSSIADTYGVSTRELMQLNGLRNPNQLVVGRTLRIPITDKMTVHYHRTYRVQSGDTLSRIAQRHGVSVNEIMQMNNLTNANQLRVGTELRIPIRQQLLAAS